MIADPDSSNHFPPDSSYHHRQAQGKESGPRLSRVRPREEASRCRGATPRERWLVPYKDGILYGESWTARVTPRVRGSGPDDERISHNRKGECWTARVPWPAAGTTTRRGTSSGSPSPPPRTIGRRIGRSTRCQGPPPCTSPRPVSSVCGSSAQHRTSCSVLPRDGADVSRGESNRSQFSDQTIGERTQQQHGASAREKSARKEIFNTY